MARLDRLYRLLEHLRARRTPTTVDALAERLEVSRRTVLRDLERLRAQGVPVMTSVGRGGGLRLGRELDMPPLRLTIAQGIALWLTVRASERIGAPLLPGADEALDKILGALPREDRAALAGLASRVVLGSPASRAVRESVTSADPGVLREVARAFHEARALAFTYEDRDGRTSRRRVAVHGLLVQHPAWYLLAWDVEKDAARMFRVDRVRRAQVRDTESFEPRDPRALFPELSLVGELAPERRAP